MTIDERNLAVESMPRSWDDIFGHDSVKVKMKKWVSSNQHPYFIWLSGPSGIGKNCLVNTYIKSVLCLNRQPDLSPCGECSVCKQDVRSLGVENNVIWVEKGKSETVTQQFNFAIKEAHNPPFGYADDPTRHWKFIVINEVQSIDKGNLNNLLYVVEYPDLVQFNKVIFIAMTMDEEDIIYRSKELFKALKGRACDGYCPLSGFTREEVKGFLKEKYKLSPEILDLLAMYSEGSLRNAIGALAKIKSLANGDSITEAWAADTLHLAPKNVRIKFWTMLEQCVVQTNNYTLYRELKELWQSLCNKVPLPILVQQLLGDIDECIAKGYYTEEQFTALQCLHNLLRPMSTNSWYTILLLRGMKIIKPELLTHDYKQGIDYLIPS